MKLFRRKITSEYVRKHYKQRTDFGPFEIYEIGRIYNGFDYDTLFFEVRNKGICLLRGGSVPPYWICDIEYIYQLKQMLKIYKIL